MSSPLTPGDTISEGCGPASLVQAVQITDMTTVVPPGTFELVTACWHVQGRSHVVVLITGTELHAYVIRQRITFKQNIINYHKLNS